MKKIDCSNTKITKLTLDNMKVDVLIAKDIDCLEYLSCQDLGLTSIDVSNDSASLSLQVGWNKLKELDVSSLILLDSIWCQYNSLEELKLGNNKSLRSLYCFGNSITDLDLSNNVCLVGGNFIQFDSTVNVIWPDVEMMFGRP